MNKQMYDNLQIKVEDHLYHVLIKVVGHYSIMINILNHVH